MRRISNISFLVIALTCVTSWLSLSIPVYAVGTFQLLNFPTSTKVIVGQSYSFYVSFLYSGNSYPNVSFVGTQLPDGQSVGAVTSAGNGLYNVQVSGKEATIQDYPLTLELTDNDGAFLTQPFDFDVVQALPAHAHAVTTTTWACDDGYEYNGIGCQLPANGVLVGGQLDCNAGYVDYNGTCQPGSDLANNLCYGYTHYNGTSSAGSFSASGTLTCVCETGYEWNAAAYKCEVIPSVAPEALVTATPTANPTVKPQWAQKTVQSEASNPRPTPTVSPSFLATTTPYKTSSINVASATVGATITSTFESPTSSITTANTDTGFFARLGGVLDSILSKIFRLF